MKRRLLSLGLLLAVITLIMTFSRNHTTLAQDEAGCCKIRPLVEEKWTKIDSKLDECTQLNKDTDGEQDNVFEEMGLVWWDVSCSP